MELDKNETDQRIGELGIHRLENVMENVKQLKPEQFKRRVGVARNTFELMVSEYILPRSLKYPEKTRPERDTSKRRRAIDDAYVLQRIQTFYHIARDYGMSEAQCWRIITAANKLLIKSKRFHLSGKKRLAGEEIEWEVVLIDASEHSIERPKKTATILFRQKEKAHTQNTVSDW